ncbi:transcriptional regulator GutM [Loigolactobacillus jiayinensis]|uniref:Transcriptional regulator GutM n=1 Tax=Loigolactobacillus jiayinensis TaxID=2486016 RepID=A0ABW1RAQ7_9LACO|nr:transcriptional regulator GutM [Loigolactobacillus jiayinensis]
MLIIILIIFVAFILQAGLGFLQLQNFTHHYQTLRRQGRVLIGRNPKRFQAGTLLLVALDQDGVIRACQLMKGVTIFARFQTITRFNGQRFIELVTDYKQLAPEPRLLRQCLLNAYQTLIKYHSGQLNEHDFSDQTNFFDLPLVTYARIRLQRVGHYLKKVGS